MVVGLRNQHWPHRAPIDPLPESLNASGLGPPNIRTDLMASHMEASLGKATHVLGQEDRLKQYLDNTRQVLRFWCVWDDRNSMYGDRRPYVLHYFLEDDSVEILEVNETNSGRDPFP